MSSKQRVAGSNPAGRANSDIARVCEGSIVPESREEAIAHPLADAVEAFLLRKRAGGCPAATMRIYGWWLRRHQAEVTTPSSEAVLFCDRPGRPLKNRHLVQILHRLSTKAGLPHHRRLHPQALRHFAAT